MHFNSRRSPVFARNGMVATSQPMAAMAGLRMLLEGGNAVDAAVAAAATLNVVEPESTGMGGDLFALLWNAKEKSVSALNASGYASAGASIDEVRRQGHAYIPPHSPYAVTVPGTVSGWHTLVTERGRMPFATVLGPAIEYAEQGYAMSPVIGEAIAQSTPKLLRHPSGKEMLRNGGPARAGEIVQLPELARSLRAVAEGGAEAFYRGPLAEKVSSYVQGLGGWLTTDDFAGYSAEWVEPLRTDYRGVDCWECPPNGQGLNALMALNLAEGFDLASMGFQSADTSHYLIESMRLAFADGLHFITDPKKVDVPIQRMLSKEHAEERRGLISRERAMERIAYDPHLRDADTVYVTCVDGEGNACSLINSLFHSFGTGLVAPGTGVALQNRGISFSLDPEHPNCLAPGKRPFHTIIPGMATRDGELWLCYGVMGGLQQAQGHLQVMSNMVDFGLDPQSALDARRFNVNLDGSTSLEQEFPSDVIGELRSRGHLITSDSGAPGMLFGGGQVIERDADSGVLTAGSDPRKDGGAVGW